ncbi:MAG: capsular polysaccharide biosynthesis protein, partial [Rhizobiales bacterium]|nr:capsular polysaccharide biosynthesis protein [Hyphomicrobiales bacterium]
MSEPVHIFSSGLWRLREEVAALTGLEPCRAFLSAGTTGAVAGWGYRPTAERAQAAAQRRGLPYIAIEDGFLRSLKPGPAQRPSSMVLDRSGIYYDAHGPSDLETLLATANFSEAERSEARGLLAEIAARRLSKYNHGRDSLPPELVGSRPLVLAIDQTAGDQSIRGGLADGSSFARMLDAAIAENPGATVVAKLHPEVI